MEIEVGEYVRTTDGKIGIFDRYSSRKETSLYKSPFNCFVKLQGRKTPLQCHEDYIVKHSKHIIDLVEVGDYVNGHKIIMDLKQSRKHYGTIDCFVTAKDYTFEENEIETILTKEQYMQNCYTVERKD